jgi:hypothetical protein
MNKKQKDAAPVMNYVVVYADPHTDARPPPQRMVRCAAHIGQGGSVVGRTAEPCAICEAAADRSLGA